MNTALDQKIIDCQKCPRLRNHCQKIASEKKRAFRDEQYWGLPVPNFGSLSHAPLLIVGLAPAAHGANRTGRMFTGDQSGVWLYRALFKAGFANQAQSTHLQDGLRLSNALITAVCHCAPPDNKPTPSEIKNCSRWLEETILATQPQVILALGQIAWNAVFDQIKQMNLWDCARPKFSHFASVKLKDGRTVMGSFHPSQQNTFTGRLTEPMFDSVFSEIKHHIGECHV